MLLAIFHLCQNLRYTAGGSGGGLLNKAVLRLFRVCYIETDFMIPVNVEGCTYLNHYFRFITQWFAMPVFLIFNGGKVPAFVSFCNDGSWFHLCR